MVLLILYVCTIFIGLVATLPNSPCPNYFRYAIDDRNEVHGIITFKNDLSGSYRVDLKMSVGVQSNQNIGIRRLTTLQDVQAGGDIMYYVIFPNTPEVPEVNEIKFNGQVYCKSNPLGQGISAYTIFTAYNTFSVYIKMGPIKHQETVDKFIIHHDGDTDKFSIHHQQNVDNFHIQLESGNNPNYNFVNPITTTTSKPNYNGPDYFELLFSSQRPAATSRPTQIIPTKQVPSPSPTPPPILIENRDTYECGDSEDTQGLVVHGTLTTEGQYPWLVAMFHLIEAEKYKFRCAANLISTKHVITAAHCVRHANKPQNLPHEAITLVLGKHNIKAWATRSEIRDVREIYVHPDYNKPSDADIAIILMYKSVQFTTKIKAVCLWSETSVNIVGSEGTIVGWGRDEFFKEYVPEPKEIKMPVVSQEDCLRSDERFLKLTSERTFCAGNRNGSGVCTGDSGSGFVMKRNGRWTIRGIVSSSLVDPETRSCDVNNYMVFADVVKHKRWIDQVLIK